MLCTTILPEMFVVLMKKFVNFGTSSRKLTLPVTLIPPSLKLTIVKFGFVELIALFKLIVV